MNRPLCIRDTSADLAHRSVVRTFRNKTAADKAARDYADNWLVIGLTGVAVGLFVGSLAAHAFGLI